MNYLVFCVAFCVFAVGFCIGGAFQNFQCRAQIEVLKHAAQLDNQSAFWRDEAFRAYEEHRP